MHYMHSLYAEKAKSLENIFKKNKRFTFLSPNYTVFHKNNPFLFFS